MKSFKNILVYVDTFASHSPTALYKAIAIAAGNHGAITLMDVVEEAPWFMNAISHKAQDILDSTEGMRREKLETFAEEARNLDLPVKTVLVHGKPFEEITREVLRSGHDLVMKTANAKSDSSSLCGQTGIRLVRKCPCPVWIVTPEAPEKYSRVAVAIDPAPHDEARNTMSKKLVESAISITCPDSGVLTIVHAWTLYAESMFASRMTSQELREHIEMVEGQVMDMVNTFLMPFQDFLPEGHVELVRGEPGMAVPEFINQSNTDLLIIGTSGRSSVPQFFSGHIAEMVLNDVRCSVLVIKPDDFVSPIHL